MVQQQQQQHQLNADSCLQQDDALENNNAHQAGHHVDERSISIKCCAQLYAQWRHRGRVFKKVANRGGIQMNIKYIDTATTMDCAILTRAPIVLAIHGAPGSYQDFTFICDHLKSLGVRVIAPNFPVMRETVNTIFRHSADEKAAYLLDFLRAIKVQRVDLLISHSSAVFPSLLLLNNQTHGYMVDTQQQINNTQISFRSLALFNPPGHRLPHSMKPVWFKCGSVKFYHKKSGRALFRAFGPQFLKIVGVPVKVDNMDDVMLSATVMKNSHYRRVEEQLHNLTKLKLPTLLLFSENDKLIEKEIFYEMANFLQADSSKFDYYDNEGALIKSGYSKNDWIQVIVFKTGGHYSYLNYSDIVGEALSKLLRRVCNCPEDETVFHCQPC